MTAEMVEMLVLTAVLAQDAFWLMDRMRGRDIDAMLDRWLWLAHARGWVDVRCEQCGEPRGVGYCGRRYN